MRKIEEKVDALTKELKNVRVALGDHQDTMEEQRRETRMNTDAVLANTTEQMNVRQELRQLRAQKTKGKERDE